MRTTMKSKITRIISIICIIAAFSNIFLSVPVMAASTRKCYLIENKNTTVYSNSRMTKKYGTIYGSDEISVQTVTSSYCIVQYPAGSRTKTGYIPTNKILTGTSGKSYTAKASIATFRRPGGLSYGYISKGDTVTVLGTRGQYTQIKYPLSAGGYKYAFITTAMAQKYILNTDPDIDVAAAITNRLNAMIDGSYGNGTYETGTRYRGAYSSEQCKGFAKKVHMILFGYNIGSTKAKPNNYQISISSNKTHLVGSLTCLSRQSNRNVQNLFANARPGDFIQVRRSHGGSHSMIFLSSDSSGVKVYECNVDGRNGIQIATYSWYSFCSRNAAVSVYSANDYLLH